MKCLFVDVAVTGDHNFKFETMEKLKIYTGFRIAVAINFDIQNAIVPVIIGAVGTIKPNVETDVKIRNNA